MTRQNTNEKASAIRRLARSCPLLAFAFCLIWTTSLAAQTVAPPNSVLKAGNVYGLASGPANIGTGNVAGGYFGNGSGAVFDVAITNGTGFGTQLFVFQSNGDGSFSLQPSGVYNFGTAVQDGLNLIVAGPVVSPTSKDLVVTDDFSNLYLLKGNGDGTFQAPLSLNQIPYTLSSYLNSGGTLNLVISNFSTVTVLVNGGSGNFTPTVVPVPARSSPYVTSAFALNAGGFTAVLQFYSDGTAGLSQQVGGVFQPPVLLGALGIPSGSAVASQSLSVFTFNGQPYMTGIVITPTGALTSVASAYVWPFGVVSGAIGISPSPSLYSIPTNDAVYVTTADLDGDGIPDLIVLGGGQFSAKQTINLFLSGSPNGFAPPEIGTVGTPNAILGPGEYGTEVLIADVNGDGKNDLLLYEPSQGLTVLLNQGSGVFLTPTTYAAGNVPTSIAKADFNGDGIDDLVVANGLNSANNTSDNTISVFVSKAPGSYASQVTHPTGTHPIAVTTGKVNGNQSVFVLSAADTTGNFSNPVVGFLQGNGDGTFQPPVYFSTGTNVAQGAQPLAIAAGAFDASGNSTVAVANSDGTINLFTYQAGAFVQGATLKATSAAPTFGLNISSLAVADMNGDGNLDLVATLRAQCNYNLINGQQTPSGGAVLIFAGNGAGAFQSPIAVTSSNATYDPVSVSLGSLVNATRTDMLVMDVHGGSACGGGVPNPIVFTNGGNLTFTETDLAPQFGGLQLTAIADVNGDGANDLIFSQNGLVSALLNSGTGTFTSAPTIYVGSSSSAGLVTGSFFAAGGHDVALASTAGVALIQSTMAAVVLPPPVIVVISPSSTSLPAGQPLQFSAAVIGTTNTVVNWSVQAGGAGGTISSSGLYTAPATSGTDIVIATSAASPTAIASAKVTVTAPLPPPSPLISSVTPNTGLQGQQGLPVTITGASFVAGSTTVTVGGGSAGISVASLAVNSSSTATAVLNIAQSTVPGSYDVAVTVAGASLPATLTSGFTVEASTVLLNITEKFTLMETQSLAAPYTMTGIVAPVANYSAGSLGFVGVPAGQTVTQTLTLANVGLQPLAISAESITQDSSNSFSVTQVLCSDGTASVTETIASGVECTLTISYTAPASGTPSGTITFTDNARLSNLTSTASGSNFTQTLALSSTTPTTPAPADPPTTFMIPITESISLTDTPFVTPPYVVTGIVAPVANYSAGSLGFVGVPAGQTVTQTLTLSNVGLQSLAIFSETITQDATNSFSVTQVLCSDGTTSITETIASGSECTLTISYTAPASGTPSGSISFTDNARLSNLTSTALGSSFTQTLALSSTVATTAAPAEPATTIPLSITESITLMETPFVAPPYTVTGIAAPVVNYSAGSLGFVGIQAGQKVTQTLTVASIGVQPLAISAEMITQDSSNSFSVTQVLCSDGRTSITGTIASGVECTLTISYTAPASGTPSGTIAFTDNAALSNLTSTASGSSSFTQTLALSSTVATAAPPAEPSTTIPISVTEPIAVMDTPVVPTPYTMTGIVAPVANYSAGSLGFVGVTAGQTATQLLTVANIGLQSLTISAEAITQDSSNSFSVAQVLCSDGRTSITGTIASGVECTLTISYTAPASGTPSGTIAFTDNAGLSNLRSTASGANFTQTLALSTTASTTAAPAEPPTTIPISVTEPITVTDAPGVDNTSTGSVVIVTPVDTTTGTTPVKLTFTNVTLPGFTGLATGPTGPTPPPGFQSGLPSIYYNLSTTATYTGSVGICINYTGITFTQPPQLFHYQNGAWMNVTTSVNTTTMIACGTTTSFSPFALFQPSAFPTTTAISTAGVSYGTSGSVTVSVSSTGGAVAGSVSLSVDGGTASTLALSNGSAVFNVGVLNAATHRLSASFAAQGNFLASSAAGTISVGQVHLTIAANNATRMYGGANPTLTASYAGFVNGDTPSVLIGTLSCTTTATSTTPVGTYPIVCGGQSAANYSITYLSGQLTVGKATLTITANNLTKNFDAPNPTLTWTASRFVNGDNTSAFTTNPTCTTTATTTSPVGSYPITCSGAAAANYAFIYVPGTLTVTCHYVSIGLSPSTVAEGGSITVSWTLRSCANTTQTVAFSFTLSGPAQPVSCSPTKTEMFGLPPIALKPNTLQSLSFPFKIPKGICPGTYSTTATTTINGQVVDTSSTSLTITAH